ncbi:MAG: RnfABCDGE type electron transport complex subunit D [Planctomycetes bacterium]|nr:RnfABCDGE type electron transport complex subunit D [Planctomycetota bacterium]
MWSVAAALAPAAVFAGYVFGCRAYLHIGLAVATAVGAEAVITYLRFHRRSRDGVKATWWRRSGMTIGDGSAVVTGLLVAFCLPAQARWFVPVVAAGVAIAIAKQAFGGLGCNIWNPALVGRAFVHVSFPTDMNPAAYPVLTGHHFLGNVGTAVGGMAGGADAVTGASPMAMAKSIATQGYADVDVLKVLTEGHGRGLWDMFVGTVGGDLGETSALLLLVGAAYLIYKGWIRWQVPLAYLGTVAAGALLLPLYLAGGEGGAESAAWQPILLAMPDAALRFVLWHLLGGGLMLGALYMATDMVTSPLTNKGLWIFGAGCGVLTILFRLYSHAYPEGVCYSILLMNTAVPLIDRWTRPRIFGHKR